MKTLRAVALSGILISSLLTDACKKNKEEYEPPAGPGNLAIKLDTCL
jgi:hypothetical protein